LNELFQKVVGDMLCCRLRQETALVKVVAIGAVEVASRADGLGRDVKCPNKMPGLGGKY
jgi:hypothetical protein